METAEKEIVTVITTIMARLDDLEFRQDQHKEMFYKVKKRLIELNDNLNDILDIIEGGDMEMIDEVKTKYSDLRNLVDDELEKNEYDFDDDDARELMNQIIGES